MCSCIYRLFVRCRLVRHNDQMTYWMKPEGQARECFRRLECLKFSLFLLLKDLDYVGSGCQVCTFTSRSMHGGGLETAACWSSFISRGCWGLFGGDLSFSFPVHLSVQRRRKKEGYRKEIEGGGGRLWEVECEGVGGRLVPSQSEKRLAKDLRRLRMVSAFTSSWLRLARGAGVSGMLKVLVRDWDLL